MLPLRQILFGKKATAAPAPLPQLSIDLDGAVVSVKLKRHAAARRMVLRLARDGTSFTLTLPKRQSITSARSFIEASRVWMQNTLAHRGRSDAADVPTTVTVRGESYALLRTGKLRGLVIEDVEARSLHVPGGDAHWQRRLTDWLKDQAEADLRRASLHYAGLMGCRFSRMTVRDQKSRWGSCSAEGALSYSWRLVLAPPFVLDYVAAHEVAHLREMNHGPRFWRLVLTHCARTREAQSWLKLNGHKLHHL